MKIFEQTKTPFWRMPALTTPHGFFTRNGGVSSGIYDSLNCGFSSHDKPENVAENRLRVAQAIGATIRPETVAQCHSADVLIVEAPQQSQARADALVTKTPGLPIGIITADCAPVLFYDPIEQVVGAAHAGWQGALGGILENTLSAMEKIGAKRQHIKAVIGPCISLENYEVGPEFLEEFRAHDSKYEIYFTQTEKIHFDLPRFVMERLKNLDVDTSWIGECTYQNPDQYFSYRRATHQNTQDYGREISLIMLDGKHR